MSNKVFLLHNDLDIFDYYSFSGDSPVFINAKVMPFLFYPNGIPCFEANAYMIHLFKQNLSTLNGGSLLTYASLIGHFIKFIYSINLINGFTNLNNNHFTNFIHSLSENKRSNRQIIRIGKQCIDFLLYISILYNMPRLIGVGGDFQIKLILSKKRHYKNISNKFRINSSYLHQSFPITHKQDPQFPITLLNINKLREKIRQSNNYSSVIRNLCILDFLQITGARRTELILLTVEDVFNALNKDESFPLLNLRTLKRRDSVSYRKVPVPKNFLLNISKYIRHVRNKTLLRKNIEDHGFVFISHTTGKSLSPDTITTYLNKWSQKANIIPPAHSHQFRHRFITEKFKSLIKEHDISNIDPFRKTLISDESLKQEVLQWTGHSHIDSLSPYLHLAVTELSGLNNISIKSIASMNSDYNEMKLLEMIEDYKAGKIDRHELENFLTNIKK